MVSYYYKTCLNSFQSVFFIILLSVFFFAFLGLFMSLLILLMASQNQMTNVHELVVIIKNRAVTFIANYQKAFTLVVNITEY